jgi:hypothetical protein
MLTHDDVRGLLGRLKAAADRADKALAAGDDIQGLDLATAAVELDKMGQKLGKIAARLQAGGNAGGRPARRRR